MRSRASGISPFLMVLLVVITTPARAQEQRPAQSPAPASRYDPLFVGYESEPAMDFGGRMVVSLQDATSRAIASIGQVGTRHPAWAPAWEFPVAIFLQVVQHEVMGHGARAREFGLSPSYRLGFGHGSVAIAVAPATNEEGVLLDAGGVEANGVLAQRVLLDMLAPGGADGAKIPLAVAAKLDLTMYVLKTGEPVGNVGSWSGDIDGWLVWRQAQRQRLDPAQHRYQPDLSDPALLADWNAAHSAAIWNALDPSLIAATIAYFRDHVARGRVRVRAPLWHVADGVGLTIGTRAALGAGEVSRFLDVYAVTRWGVASAYVRDLSASGSRTFGYGGAVRGVRPLGRLSIGVAADAWTNPPAADVRAGETGWNAAGDVDAQVARRWGLTAKLGSKSAGFFPGLPLSNGPYGGLGVTITW